MLIGKIIVFIICAISAVLTFRGEWVIKTFSKNESPSEKQIMRLNTLLLDWRWLHSLRYCLHSKKYAYGLPVTILHFQ